MYANARQIVDNKRNLVEIFDTCQFVFLILGVLFYFIWHVYQMYLNGCGVFMGTAAS